MADQEHLRGTGHTADVDLFQGQPSIAPPVRRDTGSTSSSEDYVPLAPGRYTLPINGNCPRCSHHHKAVRVKVRVFTDLNRVSHVRCENCHQKWLAFGEGNSTRISLLSQCTETDPMEIEMEKDFRFNLIRSVTSVASLSNIPEFPSRQPSREPSVRNDTSRSGADDTPMDGANPRTPEETPPQPAADTYEVEPAHGPSSTTRGEANLSADTRRTKKVLTRLKRKLKDHLPQWKPFRFKQFLRPRKVPPRTEKGQGKLPTPSPAAHSPVNPQDSYSVKDVDMSNNYPADDHDGEAGPSDPNKLEAEKHQAETPGNSEPKVDKEELKNMTKEQRIAWLRKQFTKRKCRCTGNCHCRRTSTGCPNVRGGVNGGHIPAFRPHAPAQGHPEELIDLIRDNDYSYLNRTPTYARSLSIGSTTIVGSADGLTATSGGPRLSTHYLDLQRERRRSRSPRPNSFHAPFISHSRLRQNWPDSADGRSSGESLDTGGAVRSLSGLSRRGTDGFALPVAPTSMPAGYEGMGAEFAQGYVEVQPTTNPASTPQLNGFRTPSERNQDSPSPP